MKNYLICDDNICDLDIIKDEIDEYYSEKDEEYNVYQADSADIALKYAENLKIDILFLDIDMPEISGFDIASKISKNVECIVFVSCHDEFVYESFKYNPYRFIRKGRIYEIHEAIESYSKLKKDNDLLQLKTTDEAIATIRMNDIVYIESYREKLYIYLDNEKFEVRIRMKNIIQQLNENFLRVHRGYIINLKKIHQIAKSYVEINYNNSMLKIPITRNTQSAIQSKFAEVMRK